MFEKMNRTIKDLICKVENRKIHIAQESGFLPGSIPSSTTVNDGHQNNMSMNKVNLVNEVKENKYCEKHRRILSAVLDDTLIEMLFNPKTQEVCLFTIQDNKKIRAPSIAQGEILYIPKYDEAISKFQLLLPSDVNLDCEPNKLCKDIIDFIKKYIILENEDDYEIAARYVMLTWVYDRFSRIPYLRILGTFGSGKSRFLSVLNAICYHSSNLGVNPTPANIYRWIDEYPSTVLFDEVEISNERDNKNLIHVLNMGNDINSSIVRQEHQISNRYTSKIYKAFSPKIFASRNTFNDDALESRILTIYSYLSSKSIFGNIPNYPDWEEAVAIRNRLLGYRFIYFRSLDIETPIENLDNPNIEPRDYEMIAPLVFVTNSHIAQETIIRYLEHRKQENEARIGLEIEGRVISKIAEMYDDKKPITIKELTKYLIDDKIVPNYTNEKYVGNVVRGLGLRVRRRNTGFIIDERKEKINDIGKRYGLKDTH